MKMRQRGDERKRRGLRGGGGGGGWCGVVVVLCCVVMCCGMVVCVCMLRNKFLSRVRTQHRTLSVCSFLQIMAGEEVAHHVVGNDSGMYKAGFAGDEAPRAVPSDAKHDGQYGPDGRKNMASHILLRTQGCA